MHTICFITNRTLQYCNHFYLPLISIVFCFLTKQTLWYCNHFYLPLTSIVIQLHSFNSSAFHALLTYSPLSLSHLRTFVVTN
jgi:hypothetical protein